MDSGLSFSWRADDYVRYQRTLAWYLIFGLVTSLILTASYYLSDADLVSTLVLAVLAAIFLVYALIPPKSRHYHLSSSGLQIGSRFYKLDLFESFNLLEAKSPDPRLQLIFNNRLMVPLSFGLPADQAPAISRFLSDFIKYDPGQRPHPIDRLMTRLRF